jgi:hypothetical protein
VIAREREGKGKGKSLGASLKSAPQLERKIKKNTFYFGKKKDFFLKYKKKILYLNKYIINQDIK